MLTLEALAGALPRAPGAMGWPACYLWRGLAWPSHPVAAIVRKKNEIVRAECLLLQPTEKVQPWLEKNMRAVVEATIVVVAVSVVEMAVAMLVVVVAVDIGSLTAVAVVHGMAAISEYVSSQIAKDVVTLSALEPFLEVVSQAIVVAAKTVVLVA